MSSLKTKYFQISKDYTDEEQAAFVHIYKTCFALPPYYEKYETDEVVNDVLIPHVEKGVVALAKVDDQIVGLSCAMPIDQWEHDEEFQEFIHKNKDQFNLDLAEICFMTELAVLPDFWHRGIGTHLIKERISWAKSQGFAQYMMRTASDGSNSISLYLKLGAKKLSGFTQDVSRHAAERSSKSNERVYLLGQV